MTKNKKGPKHKRNEDLDTIMPATKVRITRSVKTSNITSPNNVNGGPIIIHQGGGVLKNSTDSTV